MSTHIGQYPSAAEILRTRTFDLAWGVPTVFLTAAATCLCCLLLFAPPFVLLLPVCASGLKRSWRAVTGEPAGSRDACRRHVVRPSMAHAALWRR